MKNGVPYLALGIGLQTGTLIAYGQTLSPTLGAQAPVTVPPSGVLITQPPAPVGVPPSGVLVPPPTAKTGQKIQTAKRATLVTMRRHGVHSAARRETITRTTTAGQNIAAAPSVVSRPPEQPRNDRMGYELFLSQIGKGKEAK